MGAELIGQTCTDTVNVMSQQQIKDIHVLSRHPSIKRMLYFVSCLNPAMAKVEIKQIIKNCEMCQSIDPAPARWQKGCLEASDAWERLGIDFTHYSGNHFLTLINCGPTHFGWHGKTQKTFFDRYCLFFMNEVHWRRFWLTMTLSSAAKPVRQCLCEWEVQLWL